VARSRGGLDFSALDRPPRALSRRDIPALASQSLNWLAVSHLLLGFAAWLVVDSHGAASPYAVVGCLGGLALAVTVFGRLRSRLAAELRRRHRGPLRPRSRREWVQEIAPGILYTVVFAIYGFATWPWTQGPPQDALMCVLGPLLSMPWATHGWTKLLLLVRVWRDSTESR
jgi:hypothetical protein